MWFELLIIAVLIGTAVVTVLAYVKVRQLEDKPAVSATATATAGAAGADGAAGAAGAAGADAVIPFRVTAIRFAEITCTGTAVDLLATMFNYGYVSIDGAVTGVAPAAIELGDSVAARTYSIQLVLKSTTDLGTQPGVFTVAEGDSVVTTVKGSAGNDTPMIWEASIEVPAGVTTLTPTFQFTSEGSPGGTFSYSLMVVEQTA